MIEYLKRKFSRLSNQEMQKISFPHYYEENGKIVKELENGEKWEVMLDANYQEVLIARIK